MRFLRRAPAFSLLATAVLALGIGATTVMYTLVHGVLLRELPFARPEQLVWMYNARTERDRAPLSMPDVEDYRRESRALADVAVFTNWTINLTGVGMPERLEGVKVSGHFFELLGTHAALGRVLTGDDETRGARVVVLTHGLWLRRFGGDAGILGEDVSLNGARYTVVGVLPARFVFPFRQAEIASPVALRNDPRRTQRGANFLRVVARLAPDVTPAAAEADLDAIARRLQQRHPAENAKKIGISLYPLHTEIVRDYRTMLWTLFGAVGVLLLVGCVNLATLLLVRAAGRDAEFAIRASLGATPLRLARQVLGETVLLAAVGGMAGIVVAYFGLRAWRVWGPADFPSLATTALDWNGCLFAGVMTVGAAITCAAVPAWFASRHAAQRNTDGMRTTTISRAHATVQRALLSAEVAAATVLLVAMLLMARGFARLERVAPGFTPGQTLAIQLNLPPAAYGNRDALTQFFDALRERLRTIPGVESAGAVSLLPLSGFLNTVDIALPDQPTPPPDEVPQAHLRIATSEYFAAAGIQVFQGRAFDDHDNRDGRPVAVVSRTFAERHWPGRSALGKRVQILESSDALSVEVVGVVNDVKQFTLDAGATADLYVPLHQVPAFQAPAVAARMNWVIRARLEPAALIETFRKAVAAVDPGVAASGARTLESVWLTALGPTRASVRLLEAFGYVALVLCAMGVYGVAAFSARARRRELAIRAALGATTSNLTMRMLRQEFVPVLRGLGLGTFVALVAAPVLFSGAYATNPRDAVTYAQVAMLLLTVALMAISLPIRAAGRTNPSDALSA